MAKEGQPLWAAPLYEKEEKKKRLEYVGKMPLYQAFSKPAICLMDLMAKVRVRPQAVPPMTQG